MIDYPCYLSLRIGGLAVEGRLDGLAPSASFDLASTLGELGLRVLGESRGSSFGCSGVGTDDMVRHQQTAFLEGIHSVGDIAVH